MCIVFYVEMAINVTFKTRVYKGRTDWPSFVNLRSFGQRISLNIKHV